MKLNAPFFKRTALALCLSFISFSAMADLETDRKNYQKINELLASSQSNATQQLAREILKKIQNYPLAPYAEYQLLNVNKANLTLEQIEAYQQQNPTLPFANFLKKDWLQSMQQQQKWQAILAAASKLPLDTGSQCILVQAKANQAALDEAEKAKSETENSNAATANNTASPEAKFPQDNLTSIWLTGQSLPNQCDPILAQWNAQGGLTPELVQQRAVLAYEQGNDKLLAHLQNFVADPKKQRWTKDLQTLMKSPSALFDEDNLFFIEKLANEPLEKRIVLATMPAYIKSLNSSKIQDLVANWQKFETWAKNFDLTANQLNEWKKLYLAQFFDVDNPEFQTWRDLQLIEIKDDKLTERRVRMAIRKKDDYAKWINLLSESSQSKDEWQYWTAQGLIKKASGDKKSQEILTALSKTRGFYGMLAAQQLGIAYSPEMKTLSEPKPVESKHVEAKSTETKSNEAKTEKSAVKINEEFKAELARITELRYFKDDINMNREWRNLLDRANFEQKLQLSDYANRQGWYDLGVEATIQAKAWDYLSLRLPNAYQDWFDLNLNGKTISRTFAMAIARQESAWRPAVTSSANARGLMQLLPSTAKLTANNTGLPYSDESQLFEPFNNIMLGTAHLQELADKYGNNRILIAAAYNAGANRVDQWLERANGKLTMAEFVASIPFFETRGYVQNVLAYDTYYQILQNQPQQLFSKDEFDRLY